MKKQTFLLFITLLTAFASQAQTVTNTKWHYYTLGGKKNYFVKTVQVSDKKLKLSQFGSGDSFDKTVSEVEVVEIETTNEHTKVFSKYAEDSYTVHIFKNITTNEASVFGTNESFETLEAAKNYAPKAAEEGTIWYTAAGYASADKKKVMPPMDKKAAVEFAKFMVSKIKDIKTKMDEVQNNNATDDEKVGKGLALALIVGALPSKYAEMKGFHPYKSMSVIEKSIKKFENDKDIKKIMNELKTLFK